MVSFQVTNPSKFQRLLNLNVDSLSWNRTSFTGILEYEVAGHPFPIVAQGFFTPHNYEADFGFILTYEE